jgi:adenosylhomocysteine nucleosidase
MKIGIIGAMEEEISQLNDLMKKNTQQIIAGRIFHEGTINNIEVITVLARIGKVAASATTTTLILHFQVDAIIFTGVAGAIDSSLNIGDIVISDNLVQHDLDASPIFPKYQIPILGITNILPSKDIGDHLYTAAQHYISNKLFFELTKEFLSEFGIAKPKVVYGTIVSGDQFVKNEITIERIRNEIHKAKCVEMEGAAVAQVCHEFNIPFSVVRIISDKADHTSPVDFSKFLQIASYYSRGIIKNFMQQKFPLNTQ